jgi:tetratricopeptide (TPR) repeat protein
MRLGILAAVLAVAAGFAYWTVAQQHKKAQWVTAYREASDSYERMHYADAEAQLRVLLPDSNKGDDHQSALTMNLLALVYHAEGHQQDAEPLFAKAIQIFQKEGQPSQMDLAKACHNQGRIYLEEGRLPDADRRIQQALDIFQKEPAAAGAELGSALQNMGLVRRLQKRDPEAQALLEQALQIFEKHLSPLDLNLAQGYLDLAVQYRHEGLLKNAQETDQKALVIQEHAFGVDSPAAKATRARIALESQFAPPSSSPKVAR